jgi:hypothetical protein
MKQKYLSFSCVILLMLVLTGCSGSGGSPVGTPPGTPPGTVTGSLVGTVVDSASGLAFWNGQATMAGKTVQISGGQFEFSNIPEGTYTLTVSKAHYQDKTIQVQISRGNSVIDVKMEPSYSSAHLDLFARLVHAESRGEPYEGQVAVAASVLNRVRHRNYPNTLYGVITQRDSRGYAQYSPIDDGSINNPAGQSAKDAVRDALAGWDPSQGATGFFAPAKVPNKNNWVWKQVAIVQIGNHLFFRSQVD